MRGALRRAVLGSCVILSLAVVAQAQVRPGFRHLDIVLDRSLFDELCEFLDVSTLEDRMVAERLFHDYVEEIRSIDDLAASRMAKAGWHDVQDWERRRIELILQSDGPRSTQRTNDGSPNAGAAVQGDEVTSEILNDPEIQRLKYTCNLERYKSRLWADRRLRELLAALHEDLALTDEVAEQMPRFVRRRLFTSRSGAGRQYFNVSFDLHDLVEEACEEDPEFPTATADPDVSSRLERIMRDYELALDNLLVQGLATRARRRPQPDDKLVYTPDDAEWDELKKRQANRAHARYSVLNVASAQIGDALVEHGFADAAERWRDRVDKTMFPTLFRSCSIDNVVPWLRAHEDRDSEQLASITLIYEQYVIERRRLRRRAVDATVGVMRSHFIPSDSNPTRLDETYARRLWDLNELGRTAAQSMESCLTTEQMSDLRSMVFASARFGPPMSRQLLQLIQE